METRNKRQNLILFDNRTKGRSEKKRKVEEMSSASIRKAAKILMLEWVSDITGEYEKEEVDVYVHRVLSSIVGKYFHLKN